MHKKRVKSIKIELLKKAREAMLAAVQIYNNPQITFKTETFITLSIIAWTYLFHAYYKKNKIDYRYISSNGKRKSYLKTKYGAFRYWELKSCIEHEDSPIDNETKANLSFLIGIRNEIEHQMTNKIDEYLSAKLQACAINFDYYICKLFGETFNISNALSLNIQFSPLLPEQKDILLNNEHLTSNVRNFISSFEDILPLETLTNSHYAYRILFTAVNVNRKGQADRVIEFIKSDSVIGEQIEKSYAILKETEKKKFLPKEIVDIMIAKGYTNFSVYKHTKLWQLKDAKNNKYNYGVLVSKTWYWYQKWVDEVEKYCKENE